jgi:hypothetical protein
MTSSTKTPSSDPLFSIEPTNVGQCIKELYFKNGQGSVFTYSSTRVPFLLTVVFIILSTLFYLLSVSFNQVSYVVIFTLAGLFGIAMLVRFLVNAQKYYKWKKAVNAMIKTFDNYDKICLNLNSSGFEAVYDEQIVIEKWANFERATISPTHIYLVQQGADYLFPAKSMLESEYEALSQLVRSKVAKNT